LVRLLQQGLLLRDITLHAPADAVGARAARLGGAAAQQLCTTDGDVERSVELDLADRGGEVSTTSDQGPGQAVGGLTLPVKGR